MYFSRIRDLREDADQTQQAVADYLNMQRCVYRRYELGEREIPVWAVIRLAEYYHVSTDYLLGLTERKNDETSVPVHSRLFDWLRRVCGGVSLRCVSSGGNCCGALRAGVGFPEAAAFAAAAAGASGAVAGACMVRRSIGQCCFARSSRSARGSRQRFRRRFWNIRQARAMDVPFLFAWRQSLASIRAVLYYSVR